MDHLYVGLILLFGSALWGLIAGLDKLGGKS